MKEFFRQNIQRINSLLDRVSGTKSKYRYSLGFLNCTQFLSVLNDNIYKLSMVFLLINTLGQAKASTILAAAGAIYVIPFLLFSSVAGILADRFSKQRLLLIFKVIEILTMFLALFAFGFKNEFLCYFLLFLLGTHSAMFSPPKYGIIAELVSKEAVSRANGLISSFAYLAMILGTFLASFLTEITNGRFVYIALFCFLIALVGLLAVFGIKYTYPQGSQKKISLFFIREVFLTLKFCRTRKHLLITICASAFFLFIGSFTQLNIIPYGIESLHLTPDQGGYLFLSTALGIAIGAYLSGKVSKIRIELGLSCLAALFITLLFFLLSLFSHSLVFVVIVLVLLGISGGLFIIPFDTYNQLESTNEKRGQVIATANFLSFFGVLLASFALYLFNKIFGFSAAGSFAMIGLFSFLISCLLIARLSDYCFSFFAKKFIRPFYKLEVEGKEKVNLEEKPIFILQESTLKKVALLLSLFPQAHFILPKGKTSFSWFISCLFSVKEIEGGEKQMIESAKAMSSDQVIPCLCFRHIPTSSLATEKNIWELFKKPSFTLIEIKMHDQEKPSLVKIEFIPL